MDLRPNWQKRLLTFQNRNYDKRLMRAKFGKTSKAESWWSSSFGTKSCQNYLKSPFNWHVQISLTYVWNLTHLAWTQRYLNTVRWSDNLCLGLNPESKRKFAGSCFRQRCSGATLTISDIIPNNWDNSEITCGLVVIVAQRKTTPTNDSGCFRAVQNFKWLHYGTIPVGWQ